MYFTFLVVVEEVTQTYVSGPEPTVRPVRFWPDHFLLDARPLLVNAWDWHLQRNTVKLETLTNLANQGKIAKLKPFKVKPPSKISAFKDAIQQHLQAIRQHFFRQNSMNQDSSKFNNAKVSSFTVATSLERKFFCILSALFC